MTLFQNASEWIDAANAQDPNIEIYQSQTYPKELLYSNRMYERLMDFHPNASEEIQLATKAQHICRWKMPRESYPMDRVGYLKWREDLKKFHAKTTCEILDKAGYSQEFIDRVSFLIEKKSLKKDVGRRDLPRVPRILPRSIRAKTRYGKTQKHPPENLEQNVRCRTSRSLENKLF